MAGIKPKMEENFEEVNPETWKYEKEGDSIEGIFLSRIIDVGENKSNIYHLEKDDKATAIWGSTVLDRCMNLVKIGDYVKIIYKGLGDKKPGKNAPKLFTVLRRNTEEKKEQPHGEGEEHPPSAH